jgi:hypothetical protein
MSSYDRRAAARRRAWGRGPMILRFEPLEGRRLLSTAAAKPDLVATQFSTVDSATWGSQISAVGTIANRGKATTTRPALVDIYASSIPDISSTKSVTELLGQVVVPAGLAPGAVYNFNQPVPLPPSTGYSGTSADTTIYVALDVDPTNTVGESSMADKTDRGIGIDTSVLVAEQVMPANLIGTAFSVTPITESTPGEISWGDTISVTEQIKNNGNGASPPTRARIVLTPAGATPGGYSDVTVGDIPVPAIPSFGTVNVVQQITLPAQEPFTLGSATQFTISVVQDGDFLTQPIYPRTASQGAGFDQGPIGISPGPDALLPQAPGPDLAPSDVQVSSPSLNWGQSFTVSTVVQNLSNTPAPAFTVFFIAAAANGSPSNGIFLGQVQLAAVAANTPTTVVSTVSLPSRLPFGDTVASPAYSEIYAIADPEDVINESLRTNNMASSAPVLLQVGGSGGAQTDVPTYPENTATNPALAVQEATRAAVKAKTAQLGTPKPASSAKAPKAKAANTLIKKAPAKHGVNFLASVSEAIVGQIEAIPKGVSDLLKDVGVSSSNNASTTPTPTATPAPVTTSLANNVNGFTGGTSGGTGGFGATPS